MPTPKKAPVENVEADEGTALRSLPEGIANSFRALRASPPARVDEGPPRTMSGTRRIALPNAQMDAGEREPASDAPTARPPAPPHDGMRVALPRAPRVATIIPPTPMTAAIPAPPPARRDEYELHRDLRDLRLAEAGRLRRARATILVAIGVLATALGFVVGRLSL